MLCPIVARKTHPVLLWLYHVHEQRKDAGLIIWCNISQEEIVREMDLVAKFGVGGKIQIGAFSMRRILSRKWNFEKGMFTYIIEGTREGRNWAMLEDELERRIKDAVETSA